MLRSPSGRFRSRVAPFLAALFMLFANSATYAETYYWNRSDRLTSDKDFNRAYNWTSNQNGTGKHPVSDRDDYFTADVLNTSVWTVLDADNDGIACEPYRGQ